MRRQVDVVLDLLALRQERHISSDAFWAAIHISWELVCRKLPQPDKVKWDDAWNGINLDLKLVWNLPNRVYKSLRIACDGSIQSFYTIWKEPPFLQFDKPETIDEALALL